MPIHVQCDECFQSYKVKEERAGQTLKCKSCGSRMQVPAADEETEDLFEHYGEPIAPQRKTKTAVKSKKKKSRKKGPSLSMGKLVKRAFGVMSMALGVLLLGTSIYMFFTGETVDGKKGRPVAGLLMSSVFMGVGKKWLIDE
ncbi:hypothetical protein V6x_46670 [Gimesia chilikensis]|uniref:Zinc finger/thioredoxin putative domain-containing protein n=1 Tax=Gimesia chilikensis TaxID=2605989 RepID=A0A517WI60_9PLAN|nr:hypothetical protein [Gimesia chilikensis]QDU04936.1 hypothetical protein V6x_46670 [Gimesia chilikensis]